MNHLDEMEIETQLQFSKNKLRNFEMDMEMKDWSVVGAVWKWLVKRFNELQGKRLFRRNPLERVLHLPLQKRLE